MQPTNKSILGLLSTLALVAALWAGAARAGVIYSNLGDSGTFDTTSSRTIDGTHQIAGRFTVTGSDYRLSTVEVALSGSPLYVYLRADAGGAPGTQVEYWYLSAGTITQTPQLITLTSLIRQPLKKGATYWVVVALGNAQWYRNSGSATGVGSMEDTAPWTYSSSEPAPAFRISGDPALRATALPGPVGWPGSDATDVNSAGQSAGYFLRSGGAAACLWTQGAYTLLDQPDGVFDDVTRSYSDKMNAQGQVVGESFNAGGHYRAFIWTPDSPNSATGTMADIGRVEGDIDCEAIDLNDAGQVLAISSGGPTYTNHSFVWGPDGASDPLTVWDPDIEAGRDIDVTHGDMNDNGLVVGSVRLYPYTVTSAVLWQTVDGIPTTTFPAPGLNCAGAILNNAGQVAGKGASTGANPWFYSPGKDPKIIDVIGHYPEASGAAIDLGGIAADGRVLILAGTLALVWQDDGTNAGAFTEIPVSGWVLSGSSGVRAYMNTQGQVAGTVLNPYSRDRRSFFWDPANPTTVQELSVLPGSMGPEAMSISDAGLIAGRCFGVDGYYHASTWRTATGPNQPPVLSGVPVSDTILEMAPYTFTATATDAELDSLTFSLISPPAGAAIDANTGVFTWTPTEGQGPGEYSFTVSVTDGSASMDAAISLTVTEANLPPSLDIPDAGYINEGEEVAGPLTGTDPDLPAQTLTYSATNLPAGATYDPVTGYFQWTPSEEQGGGTYPITFTVTDSLGASASHTFTLLVVEANVPPSLTKPADQSVDEGSTLSFQLQATDSDLPPQTLTYSLVSGPAGMAVSPEGHVTWTPSEDQGGTTYADIPVKVSDGIAEDLKVFSVTVNEVNQPPVLDPIMDQALDEGMTVTFTVSGSDADIPAQALTYAAWTLPDGATFNKETREFAWTPSEAQGPGNYTMFFTVTDPSGETADQEVHISVYEANQAPTLDNPGSRTVNEGELLAFKLQASDADLPAQPIFFRVPEGGLPDGAVLYADGMFQWTPTEAQGPGVYPVTVSVADSENAETSVTFNVHVDEVNQAPTPTSPTNQTVNEGEALTLQLQATDADNVAQTLTWTYILGPAGASVSPDGLFNWTPTEADGPADYTVKVQVSDGMASAETSFTVTVNEVNTPPTLTVPATLSGQTGSPVSFTATATDPDVPANTLTYSLTGTVPAGAAIVSTTGAFTWTPIYAGTYPIDVTVSDGQVSATQTVTITVALVRKLTLTGVPESATINSMETLTFTAVGIDSDPAATVTYALNRRAPAGATINATSGVFTWTPTEAQGPGTYTITVTATDSSRLTASQSIVVTVNEVNAAPTLTVPAIVIGQVGVPVTFTATATDPDVPANTLTFGLVNAPAGAAINPTTGAFAWTPSAAGASTFNVTVSDGEGGFDSKAVMVNVVATPALDVTVTGMVRQARAISVTVQVTNPGMADANDVTVVNCTLATIAPVSRLPVALRTIRAHTAKSLTLKFPSTIPAGFAPFTLSGTSSVGGYSISEQENVP